MIGYFLRTSYTVRTLKTIYGKYCWHRRWIYDVYRHSAVYEIINSFYRKVIAAFRYSIFGSIAEQYRSMANNSSMLNNSIALNRTFNFYNRLKDKLLSYSNASKIVYSAIAFKKHLYFIPLKTSGTIVFAAALTNTLLYVLMRKEIGVLSWTMRAMLLFVAFRVMFCNVGWEELKRTSLFLKWAERGN